MRTAALASALFAGSVAATGTRRMLRRDVDAAAAPAAAPLALVEETAAVVDNATVVPAAAATAVGRTCVKIEDTLNLLGCARASAAPGGGNGTVAVGTHFVAASLAGYDVERDVKPALENLFGMFD